MENLLNCRHHLSVKAVILVIQTLFSFTAKGHKGSVQKAWSFMDGVQFSHDIWHQSTTRHIQYTRRENVYSNMASNKNFITVREQLSNSASDPFPAILSFVELSLVQNLKFIVSNNWPEHRHLVHVFTGNVTAFIHTYQEGYCPT